jgi:hypothetical protein
VLVAVACLLGLFATLGCYPPPSPLPTIGPVRVGASGTPGFPDIDLWASTNCAAIGETVVFTLEVISTTTQTMVLTGTPTLDIVLEPRHWPISQPRPVRRWSQSAAYPPQGIDPQIRPGEHRTYTWEWVAEPTYGAPEVLGVNAHVATRVMEQGIAQGAGTTNLYVGVESFADAGARGMPCSALGH